MNAYTRTQRETLTGRSLEKEVFIQITARLASADPDEPGGLSRQFEALCENRRLWMILATDLCNDENEWDDDFRAAMIGLAAFVERQTGLVMNGEASVDPLVEINRNIIRGLTQQNAEKAA